MQAVAGPPALGLHALPVKHTRCAVRRGFTDDLRPILDGRHAFEQGIERVLGIFIKRGLRQMEPRYRARASFFRGRRLARARFDNAQGRVPRTEHPFAGSLVDIKLDSCVLKALEHHAVVVREELCRYVIGRRLTRNDDTRAGHCKKVEEIPRLLDRGKTDLSRFEHDIAGRAILAICLLDLIEDELLPYASFGDDFEEPAELSKISKGGCEEVGSFVVLSLGHVFASIAFFSAMIS